MSARDLLLQAAPVYLLLLLGGVLRRVKWMDGASEKDFLRICLNVLYPALIIDRVIGNPAVLQANKVVPCLLIAVGVTLASFYLARAVATAIPVADDRGTFACAAGLQNYGYIALPVTIALFHDKGVEGLLFVFSLGVELVLWTVGVGMLNGGTGEKWRRLLSPPLIGILTALTLNVTGLFRHIPQVVGDTLHQLGVCAIPLAVLLIGGIIAELLPGWKPSFRIASLGSVVRLLLLPALILAVAKWVPMEPQFQKVLLVQAAMPSAVFTVILARMYHGNPPTAVQVIIATTFLSLLSLPLTLQWGMAFLGISPT